MNVDLGLTERELRVMRRCEFPVMLRDHVADGAEKLEIILDAATALMLAEDIEFAVNYRAVGWEGSNDDSTS